MILSVATSSRAAWVSIYDFTQSGSDYSVVTTSFSDSLNDLYLDGYGDGPLTSLGSISNALLAGPTQASTTNVQTHLVYAMMGSVSGYGPLTNPGSIHMLYANADPSLLDHRYLNSGFGSGITEDVALDFNAPVVSTLGYVVQSVAVPEPSTCAMLGLGLLGVSIARRAFPRTSSC